MIIPADSIVLVRHAQPDDQHVTASNHWIDVDLTDLGRRQAEAAAARLAEELAGSSPRLVSSDLRRAARTAEAIAQRIGVEVEFAPQLREYNNGLAEGITREALAGWTPLTPPMEEILADPAGETWPQFHGRVAACMDRITSDPARPLIVVAHYGAINIILNWWLGLDLTPAGDSRGWFGASLASLAVLRRKHADKPGVEILNDTTHLRAAGLDAAAAPPL